MVTKNVGKHVNKDGALRIVTPLKNTNHEARVKIKIKHAMAQ